MQVVLKEEGPCRRTMQIEIPVEDVRVEYDGIIKMYKKQAKIPGFRPGKATAAIVEKRFGKQIQQELTDRLTQMAFSDAIKQEKINLSKVVNASEPVGDPAQPFSLDLTLDIHPEFTLTDYKKITVVPESKELTPERVEEEIQRMLEQRAQFEPVTDRSIIEGDLVSISIDGSCEGLDVDTLDDDRVKQMLKNEHMMTVADKELEAIPGVGVGLIGLSVGDEKEITTTFAEDFMAEPLAGKEVVYQVKVLEIQQKVLPELNEEFLTQVGVKTEEALRELIGKSLESMFEREEQSRQRKDLSDQLLAQYPFELPESGLAEETNKAVQELVQMNTQRGVQKEALLENKEDIYEQAKKRAAETLRLKYILNKIAEDEKIVVEKDEFAMHLTQMAMSYQMPPQQLMDALEERGLIDAVKQDVINNKTLDFLLKETEGSEEVNSEKGSE